jgi:hypothetical protein
MTQISSNGEILNRHGEVPMFRLTPTMITLISSIFVTVLIATVFVIRLDDKVSVALVGQQTVLRKFEVMDARLRRVETRLGIDASTIEEGQREG